MSPLRPLLLACALLLPVAARADPHADYMLHCQGCHGPSGAGLAGAVPSFRGELGRFLLVEGGREYLVRVPGTSQSELSDVRIAALLNWMLREFSPGLAPEGIAPYSGQEIAGIRRPPLTDVAGERRRLLEAIAAVSEALPPR